MLLSNTPPSNMRSTSSRSISRQQPWFNTRAWRRSFVGLALVTVTMVTAGQLVAPSAAHADPHPLPYSYPYSTLPSGMSEFEQYIDLSPVRAFDTTGTPTTTPRGILITELEYGLTDRLELGFYLQFSTDPGSAAGAAPLLFDGLKQRLRYRFAEAGAWPVNVGLYGEIAELRNEIELEAKIILDRRLGRWHLIANLWGERELYYSGRREWVANPTGGVAFQVLPAFHVGLEYWMRGEFGAATAPGVESFNADAHHFLGPTFLVQGNRVWLAVAPYLRLDRWDRASELGDRFGRVWVRAIVGLEL